MIKLNWKLVYALAIFIDFVGIILTYFGLVIGLVLNRVIAFLVGLSFVFIFYLTNTRGWNWRLLVGWGAEEIPFLGDLGPFWTVTIWRIHKKNMVLEGQENESTSKQAVVERQIAMDQPQQA